MRKQKGITLIALVITIIVLLILAGVTIATLTSDNGLLQKAANSKQANEKGEIEEQIKLAYNEWKLGKETGDTSKLKDKMETRLKEIYGNDVNVSEIGRSVIVNVKNYEVTLIEDGTIEEGKLACLNVADGNIDLYSNGYKQYTGNLQDLNINGATEYTGKYVITGTTTENVVRVCDEGTFDIIIKNLNIDVSNLSSGASPINANAGSKAQRCCVNITLEGNNVLYSKEMAGIHFCGGRADTPVETERSTLTIKGNGYLDTECKAGYDGAGIGGNYNGTVPVCDIVINSGNINAIGRSSGCGIGGGLRQKVGNIIINGGNINLKAGNEYTPSIGEGWQGTSNNVTINNGNLILNGGIGSKDIGIANKIIINGGNIDVLNGGIGSIGSGILEINGGNIINVSQIGRKCNKVIISGGKINIRNNWSSAISCVENGIINISGGNILARGKNNLNIATYEEGTSNLVAYIPTDGTNNLYETPIKLQGVGENKKVTKLTTSDNINYGINDMYTLENGMLYLYLPAGERTITIEVDGKTYSGSVQTTETPVEVTLNEIN